MKKNYKMDSFDAFNDGIAIVTREKTKKIDFSKASSKEKDREEICRLRFAFMSNRVEDTEFIESFGRTLSTKIKTRLYDHKINDCIVLIGKDTYSIVYIDIDKKKKEMYLYMEQAEV